MLDEFGTGSDPELGGALAEVFFETLYQKGCFGVITTHYTNIKLKAAKLPHAINANMLFNKETLEPEYELMIGQPGSSFTFEVAELNGIPKGLLKAAKQKINQKKLKLDTLIADLQKEKSDLHELRKQSESSVQEMEKAKQTYEEKQQHYEQRLARQQKRIEQNNKYLSHGKKMGQFIDGYEARAKAKNQELLKEVKKYIAVEKAKIVEAQQKAKAKEKERMLAAQAKNKKKKKRHKTPVIKPIVLGATVKLKNSRQKGQVIALEGKEATVMFGNFKTKVSTDKLILLA